MRTTLAAALLATSLAATSLSGCAEPSRYVPAATPGALGYSEQALESNRYRITFRGGTDADPARAYNYALLRAADVTLSRGFDWFQIADRQTELRPGGGPQFSIGLGGGSFGLGSGVGGGVSTELGGRGAASTVTLEVIMGRGQRPSPAAYDARQVRSSIAGAPA